MAQATKQLNRVILDKKDFEDLRNKASFLEELLSFIEDKYLGVLMTKTEREKNIPSSKAKRIMK